jgi:predicted transcriptional regulator of viral defense system
MNIPSYNEQNSLSQRERLIVNSFIADGKQIIRLADLMPFLPTNPSNPNAVISRLAKKGFLQRLKAGVYRFTLPRSTWTNPVPEDAWMIARELFSPCYIGGWTAAEHWQLIEWPLQKTVIITGKKQRATEHSIAGLSFRTRCIPGKKVFGTEKILSHNAEIEMSDVHRTLIDILVDPSIGGGGPAAIDIATSYAKKNEADPDILLNYAQRLDNRAVFRRLGVIAEYIFCVPESYLAEVQSRCKDGLVLWDPQRPKSGPVINRWGIRMNMPIDVKLNESENDLQQL